MEKRYMLLEELIKEEREDTKAEAELNGIAKAFCRFFQDLMIL